MMMRMVMIMVFMKMMTLIVVTVGNYGNDDYLIAPRIPPGRVTYLVIRCNR